MYAVIEETTLHTCEQEIFLIGILYDYGQETGRKFEM